MAHNLLEIIPKLTPRDLQNIWWWKQGKWHLDFIPEATDIALWDYDNLKESAKAYLMKHFHTTRNVSGTIETYRKIFKEEPPDSAWGII